MLLGFLMGAVADVVDRKILLVATFATMTAASGTMLVVTALDAATYATAAAIVMVSGAFWTTDMPVRRRLLVDAVAAGERFGRPRVRQRHDVRHTGTRAADWWCNLSGRGHQRHLRAHCDELPRLPGTRYPGGRPIQRTERRRIVCPRQAWLSAAAVGARSRSAISDHHGGDARLQPLVLAIHRNDPSHRPEGFCAHTGPCRGPVGLRRTRGHGRGPGCGAPCNSAHALSLLLFRNTRVPRAASSPWRFTSPSEPRLSSSW